MCVCGRSHFGSRLRPSLKAEPFAFRIGEQRLPFMESLRAEIASLLKPLLRLGRKLIVAEPFTGMDGFGEMMRVGGIPYSARNVYDTADGLRQCYDNLGLALKEDFTAYQLGPEIGDMMQVPLRNLQDVDGSVLKLKSTWSAQLQSWRTALQR